MTIGQTYNGDKIINDIPPESRNMNFSNENVFQTGRSDNIPRKLPDTNFSDENVFQIGASNQSGKTSNKTSGSSKQDRTSSSWNRQSKATGFQAKHPPSARADRGKGRMNVNIGSEDSECEGRSHPNTSPPSIESTATKRTDDQTYKGKAGDKIYFCEATNSQNTDFSNEDFSQTGDSVDFLDLTSMDLGSSEQIKNFEQALEELLPSLEDPDEVCSNRLQNTSDRSREDLDEASENSEQNPVPRSQSEQSRVIELPANRAPMVWSTYKYTLQTPKRLDHSITITPSLDEIISPFNIRLEFTQKTHDDVKFIHFQVSRHMFLRSCLDLEVFPLFTANTQTILS